MNCSTKEKQVGRIKRDINADGVEYERGSVFERFGQLTDIRKARGKRYSLETVLTIMVTAKLCGCDRPMEIAEWAKNHQEQLVNLMQLKRQKLPHYD